MEEKILEMNISLDKEKENDNRVVTQGKKHFDDNNLVEMEGTIARIINVEEFKYAWFTVLTNTGYEKTETSAISVKMEKDLYEKAMAFSAKARVHIVGKVKTVRKMDKEGNVTYDTFVVATDIKAAKSTMEDVLGITGGRTFDASYNKVALIGTVTRMNQTNRQNLSCVLAISNGKGDKADFIDLSLYARNNIRNLVPHFAVGNKVCIIGEFRSARKEIRNVTVSGQDIKEEAPVKYQYTKTLAILDVKEL